MRKHTTHFHDCGCLRKKWEAEIPTLTQALRVPEIRAAIEALEKFLIWDKSVMSENSSDAECTALKHAALSAMLDVFDTIMEKMGEKNK